MMKHRLHKLIDGLLVLSLVVAAAAMVMPRPAQALAATVENPCDAMSDDVAMQQGCTVNEGTVNEGTAHSGQVSVGSGCCACDLAQLQVPRDMRQGTRMPWLLRHARGNVQNPLFFLLRPPRA